MNSNRPGELRWITTGSHGGDWYVDQAAGSPLAGSLVGVRWDSLPPAAAIADFPADTGAPAAPAGFLVMFCFPGRIRRQKRPRPANNGRYPL